MKLANRKVKMFRTHLNPYITAMPKLAFMASDCQFQKCEWNDEGNAIMVITKEGREHVVCNTIVECAELEPMVETKKTKGE